MKKSWPKVGAGKEEQVGCHVVEIETGGVYICSRSGKENATIEDFVALGPSFGEATMVA